MLFVNIMQNNLNIKPGADASYLHGIDEKPSVFGLNYFMEHYKNRSLENITEEIDGIVYTEEWKDINGYEGRYQVSTFGRIKSIARLKKRKDGTFHKAKAIIKKLRLIKFGYITVFLYKDDKYKHHLVHVLVANAFIKKGDGLLEVNHIKGIKNDNRAIKLEWLTKSDNIKHAYSLGIMSQKGEKHASNKLNNEQVLFIFHSGEPSLKLSKKYGVTQGSINNIRTGTTWSHLTGKIYKKQQIYDCKSGTRKSIT